MCRLYDNTWFEMLEWAKLGVIGLALAWVTYRSGALAPLERWRRRAAADLAEALPPEEPQAA
jgi:hypothetical protein